MGIVSHDLFHGKCRCCVTKSIPRTIQASKIYDEGIRLEVSVHHMWGIQTGKHVLEMELLRTYISSAMQRQPVESLRHASRLCGRMTMVMWACAS